MSNWTCNLMRDSFVRNWLPGAAATAAFLIAIWGSGVAQPAQAAGELIVVMPPGYGKPMERTIGKVMKERFGTTVTFQESMSATVFAKLMAQKSAPEFDVACNSISDFLNSRSAGLTVELDLDKIPNAAHSWDFAKKEPFGKYGQPITLNGSVLQYRTDIFQKNGWPAPTKWTDLANPAFKGHVGLTSLTSGVGMETLWVWSKNKGAPRGNVDPGIAFAKELVKSGQVVAFPKRGSEANQLLMTGEIWITTQYSQASLQLQGQGAPVATVYPQDGPVVNAAVCYIVKGGPNPAMAVEFLNLALGEEAQREFATTLWSSPVFKGLKGLPPEYEQRLLTTQEQIDRAFLPDSTEFAEFKMQWYKRWIEEVETQR